MFINNASHDVRVLVVCPYIDNGQTAIKVCVTDLLTQEKELLETGVWVIKVCFKWQPAQEDLCGYLVAEDNQSCRISFTVEPTSLEQAVAFLKATCVLNRI